MSYSSFTIDEQNTENQKGNGRVISPALEPQAELNRPKQILANICLTYSVKPPTMENLALS